jgi:ATP-binding cassette subfamily F protein uup
MADGVIEDEIQMPEPSQSPGSASGQGKTGQADSRPRTMTWKESREKEELEKKIASLEIEKEYIEAEINKAGGDFELLQTLSDRLVTVESELEQNENRWLELSDIGG